VQADAQDGEGEAMTPEEMQDMIDRCKRMIDDCRRWIPLLEREIARGSGGWVSHPVGDANAPSTTTTTSLNIGCCTCAAIANLKIT